jgi:hypothetical protein
MRNLHAIQDPALVFFPLWKRGEKIYRAFGA